MKTKYFLVALTVLALLALAGSVSAAASQTVSEPQDGGLMFVENVGQFDPQVRFMAQGGNSTLWVTEDGLWVTMQDDQQGVAVKLSFVGASPQAVEPFGLLETRFGYFLGDDPAQWHPDVPVWGGVRYVDLYPGIDLELAGADGQLAQKLVVRDAAHLGEVNLLVDGAQAVAEVDGMMVLETAAGTFATPKLTVVGTDTAVEPSVITPGDIEVEERFFVPMHTATLTFSTYLGGTSTDKAWDVDDDNFGNSYVCGETQSSNFPKKTGSFDVTHNGMQDIFLVKYSSTGAMKYGSFLGGNNNDVCRGLYVENNGPVYLTGHTFSANYPTTVNAYDRTLSGGRDVFVAVMLPSTDYLPVFQLLYSSFLGGDNWEYGFAIVGDAAGAAYVCGYTHGSYPIKNAAQPGYGGGVGDAFVTKLDTSPLRAVGDDGLRWSTYLGGNQNDSCHGIEETGGFVYAAGGTTSPGMSFPTTPGVYDRNCVNCAHDVSGDGFVVKYNGSTGAVLLSTLVGMNKTPGEDGFNDVEADSSGKVYLVGATDDPAFPTTANAYDRTHNGSVDATIVVLNSNFASLAYSSFYGGTNVDRGADMDSAGSSVFVAGHTNSANLPMLNPLQAANRGGYDAFVAWFDTSVSGASGLVFSTYWGGSGNEVSDAAVCGLERGDDGSLYLASDTTSTNLTTKSAAQGTNKGNTDAFVTKMKVVP